MRRDKGSEVSDYSTCPRPCCTRYSAGAPGRKRSPWCASSCRMCRHLPSPAGPASPGPGDPRQRRRRLDAPGIRGYRMEPAEAVARRGCAWRRGAVAGLTVEAGQGGSRSPLWRYTLMIRRTLLTLALLAAPAIVVAQQPSPMQGQAPAADSTKTAPAKKGSKKSKKHGAKPMAKPAAKDSSKMKP